MPTRRVRGLDWFAFYTVPSADVSPSGELNNIVNFTADIEYCQIA